MAKSRADYAQFSQDDVKLVKKETPFKGYFQIDVYTIQHRIHEGGWTKPITREVFERGHASAMLPYDPVKDIVILIEQFRPGAYAAGNNPWLLEIPAGIIEDGQTPKEVAIRETTEETGCEAKRTEFIADYIVTPGGSSETIHLYCVEVDSDEALDHAGLEEEGEHIRVLKMSSAEAFELLNNGHMHNSTGIIALQWLKLHHNNIREKWCKNK
ncbi:MAG: NUDIX domain-containing protein [Terasakiella sp.]|uniref:NUDIX domain-containing protein n=1 Tax=unclassified Terasakiella TaxID=2614952 RepID=UPI003B00C53F